MTAKAKGGGQECPPHMGFRRALGEEILGLLWTGRPRRLKPDHF